MIGQEALNAPNWLEEFLGFRYRGYWTVPSITLAFTSAALLFDVGYFGFFGSTFGEAFSYVEQIMFSVRGIGALVETLPIILPILIIEFVFIAKSIGLYLYITSAYIVISSSIIYLFVYKAFAGNYNIVLILGTTIILIIYIASRLLKRCEKEQFQFLLLGALPLVPLSLGYASGISDYVNALSGTYATVIMKDKQEGSLLKLGSTNVAFLRDKDIVVAKTDRIQYILYRKPQNGIATMISP